MGEGWGMVEPLQPQRETQGERNHQLGKAAEKASPAALAKRGREPKRTGWRSASRTPKAFGKKAKRNKSAAQPAIGKMAEEARQAFGKKGRSIRNKRRKRTWEQERWKRRCKSREKMIKQWKWTKKKKKLLSLWKKARGQCTKQHCTKQHCTKQQCCQTGTNSSCFCQWGRTWPRTQLGREEVKKKEAARKKRSKRAAKRASKLPGGGGEGWALAKRAEPAKKEGKAGWQAAICQPGHQLQQQQPGTATHTTKAFKAEGHPSPAREGGAARKAATNSTTTKAFEKKAGPGLAQLLPDQGKGGGCGAQKPHQGLLGSPSRWMGDLPPQLCWQGKGGGSAAVGQKLAHQMGRHEDSDPQNRVLGQGRMGLALQMHPCAGWHPRDSEGVLGKRTEGGPH